MLFMKIKTNEMQEHLLGYSSSNSLRSSYNGYGPQSGNLSPLVIVKLRSLSPSLAPSSSKSNFISSGSVDTYASLVSVSLSLSSSSSTFSPNPYPPCLPFSLSASSLPYISTADQSTRGGLPPEAFR